MRSLLTLVVFGLTFYSHSILAVPGNASTLSNYLSELQDSIKSNKKYSCHYSGFRWRDAYFADAYDQKSKKYYKIKEYSQYYWAEIQNKEILEEEKLALHKRIEQCREGKKEPNIPIFGDSLASFIPDKWEQITEKSYLNQFQKIPSGFSNYISRAPSTKNTFAIDLNNDHSQDLVTFIGRSTNTNIGFDEFRLMVLMGERSGGFKLAYSINADLDDMPPEGGFSKARKYSFNVSKRDGTPMLFIKNTIWSEEDIGDRWVQFGFSYKNNKFLLTDYLEANRNFEYGSTPEDKYFRRTFNFEKKSILIESSLNTSINACILSKKQQKIARKTCPEPTSKVKRLIVPDDFILTLEDFKSFTPVDFEKTYGVKVQ